MNMEYMLKAQIYRIRSFYVCMQTIFSLHDQIALSSCEGEYVAASYATCQVLQIEMLLEELNASEVDRIKLLVDNKLSIDLANHPISHDKSKHIERKFYFLRDQVNKKLELEYCKTGMQLADIFTKPLKKTRLNELKKLMRMNSLV